ncbi:MAG: ribonuclease HII [Tannerellaceae bacterium]|jgi:ribonuclease HII|nr:ribonuclease HII [Tannerellaceae bacterium]
MLSPFLSPNRLEAGCDEAGRGCLAGIVVAAAVILKPANMLNDLYMLKDSKQLSEKQRLELFPIIMDNSIAAAVGSATVEEIDKLNILKASFLAMHRAIDKLDKKPEHLLIDGNRFNPYPNISHTTIVKGDATYLSIAAASVVAKVTRDNIMLELHAEFPAYRWNENKGYPTKHHREAIIKHGPCIHHRKSFRLV